MKPSVASGVLNRVKTLENIRIASPCHANWNEMTGDERIRTCAACAKPVFNLSEMTRAEADAVIAKHGGDLCARLYHRADGTVMLADCTVATTGMRARNFVALAALVGGAAYAKLHHAEPPAEAATLATAVDEAVPPPSVTSIEHDAPPPPPDPRIEAQKRLEALRKKLEKEEPVYITGGAVSFSVEELNARKNVEAKLESLTVDDK